MLFQEFHMYCLIANDEIPKTIWDSAHINTNDTRSNITWNLMSDMEAGNDLLRFPTYQWVANSLYLEQIFSLVKQNKF